MGLEDGMELFGLNDAILGLARAPHVLPWLLLGTQSSAARL